MNTHTHSDRSAALKRLRLVAAFVAIPVLAGLGAALADDVTRMFGATPGASTDERGLLVGCALGFSILWFTWSRHNSLKQ